MDTITIRPYQTGDASYVSYLHAVLYERVYGFSGAFERYVLASIAEMVASPEGSELWVAVDSERIIGSIAIVKTAEDTAQLRWFLIEEGYQGRGLGTRLMDTAMRFCREQGYRHIFLWTITMLTAARHLYEKYGFQSTEQTPNTEWTGELLMEERRDLFL